MCTASRRTPASSSAKQSVKKRRFDPTLGAGGTWAWRALQTLAPPLPILPVIEEHFTSGIKRILLVMIVSGFYASKRILLPILPAIESGFH